MTPDSLEPLKERLPARHIKATKQGVFFEVRMVWWPHKLLARTRDQQKIEDWLATNVDFSGALGSPKQKEAVKAVQNALADSSRD